MSRQSAQQMTIARAAVGAAFGFIGAAALFVALIAFAWYVRVSLLVLVSLLVALVGFVAWAFIAPKEFAAILTGRTARYGTSAAFATLLLLGIITLAYILSQRANVAFDATLGRTYSLSDTTFEPSPIGSRRGCWSR